MGAEVLLIEDNDGDAFLFKQAASQWKSPPFVTVVSNKEQAFDLLMTIKTKFDLIVLDLNFSHPGGGFEMFTFVKAQSNLKSAPVVVLSGSNNEKDWEKAYELKINKVIQKSPNIKEFTLLIGGLEELSHSKAPTP